VSTDRSIGLNTWLPTDIEYVCTHTSIDVHECVKEGGGREDLIRGRTHQPLQTKDENKVCHLHSTTSIISKQPVNVRLCSRPLCSGGLGERDKQTRRTSAMSTCTKFDIGVIPGCHLKSDGRINMCSIHDMGDMMKTESTMLNARDCSS